MMYMNVLRPCKSFCLPLAKIVCVSQTKIQMKIFGNMRITNNTFSQKIILVFLKQIQSDILKYFVL